MSYLAKTPEDLLPCPHCGGEAEARDGSSTRPYICCKSCGCRTGSSYDMGKIKEAWNRRAWCDRDELLALADEIGMLHGRCDFCINRGECDWADEAICLENMMDDFADRIREALGVEHG